MSYIDPNVPLNQIKDPFSRVTEYFCSEVIDVRDFGAKCDDVTDDCAAVQAAIDYAGNNAATRGGAHVVVPNKCAIADTLTIDRKAIVFRSLGWGRYNQSGVQPYLRWIGSAGKPMLRLKNVQGFQARDLRFIGKASAKPSCAISLYQQAGFGNNQNLLENIQIGPMLDDGSGLANPGFENGIMCEGATANNDTWFLRNVNIQGCSGYGIRQNSIQNVVWNIDALTITESANGIYAVAGQLTGHGWSFGGVTGVILVLPKLDDQSLNTFANVHVIGLIAERSGRLATMSGGAITIEDGNMHVGSFTNADGKLIVAEDGGNGSGPVWITLRDFGFQQVSTPTTTPFISIRSSSYGNFHTADLVLDRVSGLPAGGPQSNGISAETRGSLEYKHILYRRLFTYGAPEEYTAPTFTEAYLGGRAGEVFEENHFDVPNRLRTAHSHQAQHLSAAGNAIVLGRSTILVKNTSGGLLTLTSTPTIPSGLEGEIIRILNVGTDAIVLQDQGTLANSNIRLRLATTVTLNYLDSIYLQFIGSSSIGDYSAINDWVQIDPSPAGAYQPLDSDLTDIAALTASNDDLVQRKAGHWTNRTPAQFKTDLALVKADVGLSNVDNTSDATKNGAVATLSNKTLASPLVTGGVISDDWFWSSSGKVVLAKDGNRVLVSVDNDNIAFGGSGSLWGTGAVNVLSLLNGTAPSSSPAGLAQMWVESGEWKVRDASGNVTTISPHTADAPTWLYDSEDIQPPHISREANMFSGTIRFVNHSRAARLQQLLFDDEPLPTDRLKRKTIHEETFTDYNERLGLKVGDTGYLVQESWETNEELNREHRELLRASWDEDQIGEKPGAYEQRERPKWLK